MQPDSLQNQNTPPIILVHTWCQLLRCENEDPAKHANEMLLNAFDNMRSVVEFVKKNNIEA